MSGSRRLVVEADGGSRGNPGPAAFGALVRDPDSGEVLAEVAETIGVATNNVAEYRGVIAGLRMAREIDPAAEVHVRLDSKLVVEQLSGRWKVKNSDLRPLALEARALFPPGQVHYTWVPREQNAHADRLLNQALDGEPAFFTVATPGPAPGPSPAAAVPDAVGATALVLVRHGRTADTAARRFSGGAVPGSPLDEVGRAQAQRAGEALAGSRAAAVVASPVLRCRQTADEVASRLGVEVTYDDDLRECDFGAWEGLTPEEVSERYPDEAAAWRTSTATAPQGGESLEAMTGRVVAARDRVLAKFPRQTVIVVTHSMPIRALVCRTLDAPLLAMHRMRPSPGSRTEILGFPDGRVVMTGFSLL